MITSIQDLTTLADELRMLHAALLHVKAALEAGGVAQQPHNPTCFSHNFINIAKADNCDCFLRHVREAMHTINNALQDVSAAAQLDARGIE
jgi:hypothetical protein